MAKKKGKVSKKTAAAKEAQGYDTDEATGDIVELPAEAKSKVENEFSVQADAWAAWGDGQRGMFNDLYGDMMRSPSLYNSHPQSPTIDSDQWRVISWNAALKAAACA